MLTTASALNLCWVIITIALIVRLYPRNAPGRRFSQLSALLLAGVCLFPVVSASDDMVQFALFGGDATSAFTPQSGTDGHGQPCPADARLARLLDSLDAIQVTPHFCLTASFVSSAVVRAAEPAPARHELLTRGGRAPPRLSSLPA